MNIKDHFEKAFTYNPSTGTFHWKINYKTNKVGDFAGNVKDGWILGYKCEGISARRLARIFTE